MEQAEMGILALREHVDALVVVPNEKLKYLSDTKITLVNAFEVADDVLRHGVQSISDLINIPGLINLDFADVTAVMKDAGQAHMVWAALPAKIRLRMLLLLRFPAHFWRLPSTVQKA